MKKSKNFLSILIISILIFLAQIFYLWHIKFSDILIYTILLIPVIIVIIIYLFRNFTNNKWKIFCYILGLIVLLKQILAFALLFAFHYMSTHNDWYYKEYNGINDYKIAKKQINCQKCIRHFPKEIPLNAKNIHFFQYQSYLWGSESIFLKFDIDKKYIENEIQKYNKNKISNIPPRQIFPFSTSDFQFYIIFNNNKKFLKEGGVGISGKNNTILYYYNNPDD